MKYSIVKTNKMIKETKLPSFGEDLLQVDVSYPPSNDVERIKHLFAEVAEIMRKNYEDNRSPIKSLLFDNATSQIINASSAVEKVLTYKHYTENGEGI